MWGGGAVWLQHIFCSLWIQSRDVLYLLVFIFIFLKTVPVQLLLFLCFFFFPWTHGKPPASASRLLALQALGCHIQHVYGFLRRTIPANPIPEDVSPTNSCLLFLLIGKQTFFFFFCRVHCISLTVNFSDLSLFIDHLRRVEEDTHTHTPLPHGQPAREDSYKSLIFLKKFE